ncbi:MAG: hypothetical protein GXP47_09655 [Acidobacteria bacterium]|nr:hypothetical protein [Acidobacteriota bacterium]
MSSRQRATGFATAVALALIILGGALFLLQANTSSATDKKKPCCFTNERYSGVCQVIPSENETCGDILAYLNNPMATGKDYCGNTRIRGGWKQVECE